MKRILCRLSALLAGVAVASADITIRLSVKAVLNPATGNRQPGVRTGRTWFVDRNCGAISRSGSSQCGPFSGPFAFARDGLNRAQAEDIVLIRAGNYSEPIPMTINQHVTLRASRGNVSIGIP
jgi:hypothetical protein